VTRVQDWEPRELTVYAGTVRIGYIVECDGKCMAIAAYGATLGRFKTRKEAFRAISAWYGGGRP
jgi:hypothetical protein